MKQEIPTRGFVLVIDVPEHVYHKGFKYPFWEFVFVVDMFVLLYSVVVFVVLTC